MAPIKKENIFDTAEYWLSGPGSGAESPSSRDPGRGRKGGRPLARHAPHVRGAPGAKPFVDDLLLGRGFVRSRAAPSLRSIESQPSTQGFVAPAGRAPAGVARSLFLPSAGLRLSAGGRRRVLGPGPPAPVGGAGRRPPRSGRGSTLGEERGGPPLAAPPGLGAPRPFLCFPAAGPRPRAGPGDGGRGVARARVRGRRRAAPPFPSPGGGRAGPGAWLQSTSAMILELKTQSLTLFPLFPHLLPME